MTSKDLPPTILVIVGITGDLSIRKLLPAIEKLSAAKAVPDKFKIVGITRRDVKVVDIIKRLPASESHAFLSKHLEMYRMDLANADDYQQLRTHLAELEKQLGGQAQKLFYLSVPPQISQPVVKLLGEASLAKVPHTKLLLEKPFGTDLASAKELIDQAKQYFDEDQVYRIDHYLAKDMAQNMIVFREGNALFSHTWSNQFIERIDILASEKIGIEGRAAFYEQTGALRDLVQSHLLQLTALTLMHPSVTRNLRNICDCRVDALLQLRVDESVPFKRGQYRGYAEEVSNPGTTTETFADITLKSTDPSWTGVPIRIITGKALDKKVTEIKITYKQTNEYESNELIIRFQPNEGIELRLWTKVPGYEWKVENHSLKLSFAEQFTTSTEAYEQVLLDAIKSDHSLFPTSAEVLETWRILEPIQKAWSMQNNDLTTYQPGSGIDKVS
jgi:glucose-6-phosphate 1-dehydrogenase